MGRTHLPQLLLHGLNGALIGLCLLLGSNDSRLGCREFAGLLRRNDHFRLGFLGLRGSLLCSILTPCDLALHISIQNDVAVLARLRVLLLEISRARPHHGFRKYEITRLTTAHAIVTRGCHRRNLVDFCPDITSLLPLRLAHFHLDFLVSVLVVHLQSVSSQGHTHHLVLDDLRHNVTSNALVIRDKSANAFLQDTLVLNRDSVLL